MGPASRTSPTPCCGRSGEQSPLAVRGQSMQDVIFGGVPGRQAARSAEVELVLDDSEGTLGLGAPEVSIVRRLDRSGEGEYRLAGARCRLVDVIEVLSDTGLGKEMHSVISQGRVESIVTSKPRDRRMLIEEAAGLGKHRKRRRRAQLKLARTQENLDRALDVEREARSRLRPLKRQAEAAELHARIERQTLEARWELDPRRPAQPRRRARQAAQAAAAEARARRERGRARARRPSPSRREAAEEALARRSAHREELSRRCFVAQSAAERIGYRAEAVRSGRARCRGAPARRREGLLARARAGRRRPTRPTRRPTRESRSSSRRWPGSSATARPSWLASWPSSSPSSPAAREADSRAGRGGRAGAGRAPAGRRSELEQACAASCARPSAAVEAARREAARVGGELAACNQFLRSQTAAPGGAAVLADQLEVDPGYRARRRRRARRAAASRGARRPRRRGRRCSTAPAPTAAALWSSIRRMGAAPVEQRRLAAARRAPSPSAGTSTGRPSRAALARRAAPARRGWSRASIELPDCLRRGGRDPSGPGVVVPRRASSARPRPWARSACSPSATAARRSCAPAKRPRRPSSTPGARSSARRRRARRGRRRVASRRSTRTAPRSASATRRARRSGGSRRRSSGAGRRPTTDRTPAAGCS